MLVWCLGVRAHILSPYSPSRGHACFTVTGKVLAVCMFQFMAAVFCSFRPVGTLYTVMGAHGVCIYVCVRAGKERGEVWVPTVS